MDSADRLFPRTLLKDAVAGLIVFLVALPLCLGIALASNTPLFSGLIAGIVGGIIVGALSGSHTSVTGPAAGLTAIVAAQIAQLGSFETFLLAVVIGGVLQIALGLFKAGALSAFFPSSVIKGLLAAIGVILILKQIPHVLGHDQDPEGEMSFEQPDHENTFSEFLGLFSGDVHLGALTTGLLSLALLILWDRSKRLKQSLVPAPLLVVILGVVMGRLLERLGAPWTIESTHMVQVPVASSLGEFLGFLQFPDFSQLVNPAVYVGGITIAIVASLETLLNLDAVDKLDRKQRLSPPSRELLAQGVGNVAAGLVGGLPVTSVIIRGSVNINAGSETKLSAIIHGLLLLVCVSLMPAYLNTIPLSCLAAILLVTGFKLASPKLFRQMWSEGRYQFLPFMLTLLAIVFTDLLVGIVIGLAISLLFILNSNLRRPIRAIREKDADGEVLLIELANQVSFLNRAALENAMRKAPRGSRILLDARRTDYIDPDILSLIREFKEVTAPVHDIQVALLGFRSKLKLSDPDAHVEFEPELPRDRLTPMQVMEILIEGNKRFAEDHPLDRHLRRIPDPNSHVPRAMAAIVTGIHARTPVESIFDLGLGDAYVIRTPGNVVGSRVIGGLEFAAGDGVKLIVLMGHTQSRLVRAAIQRRAGLEEEPVLSRAPHLQTVLDEISVSLDESDVGQYLAADASAQERLVNCVVRRHIARCVDQVVSQSPAIGHLVADGEMAIIGALYDVDTGKVEFLDPSETQPLASTAERALKH
ncbi:MAG: bifunctional SulP family inorganic anion transporter/carbonic anhydrase [Aureliella sp.]